MTWKHSRLRYYILNARWNYKFWLYAEKIFKEHSHEVQDKEISEDATGKMIYKKKKISNRRFVGYLYDGMMYLDNPGFRHTVDKATWTSWKEKGLIKQ